MFLLRRCEFAMKLELRVLPVLSQTLWKKMKKEEILFVRKKNESEGFADL